MVKTSTSRKPARPQFEFRIVSFGDGDGKLPTAPLRPARDMPFIVSSAEQRFPDADTQTYIRKHVMNDHISKDKKHAENSEIRGVVPIVKKEPRARGSRERSDDASRTQGQDLLPGRSCEGSNHALQSLEQRYENILSQLEISPSPHSILGAGRLDP